MIFPTSKAGRYAIAAAAGLLLGLALFWGAYFLGAANARAKLKAKELEAQAETTERINDEDADLTDPAVVLRRLCDLAHIADCPVQRDED